ncbi:MAG: CinA family nicotinamide mononucleotide deamidase-related protein [Rhizobiales bacterium]|nr:CinA family nicotinamide mononucleotide deamidase-related protein [Hyphomicrobiales bacterium]
MRCEVLAIGTELLLGQIVDTNSSWIGEQLALAGIDSHYQTKVGDNQARMVECIRLALSRSDAVICCGGLGPTQDDITREAIAEVMNVRLVRQPALVDHIRDLFEKRGREMAPSNLRQADVPEGASIIPEMPGTAPGLVCPLGDPNGSKVIYAVPGVPNEMRTMLQGTVLPDLKRRAGVTAVIKSRIFRTWGYTESGLADLLADEIAELDRSRAATIAFQASGIEGIKVRLTTKGPDAHSADLVLSQVEKKIRPLLDDYIFGIDDQTMESVVLDHLRTQNKTLAIAETLTRGLATYRLRSVPGPGSIPGPGSVPGQGSPFLGGHTMTGVDSPLLGLPPGVSPTSPEAAIAMASNVRTTFGADIGLAAVEGDQDHAPGLVHLALATTDGADTTDVKLPGDRHRISQYAVISLLNMLRRKLQGIRTPAVL